MSQLTTAHSSQLTSHLTRHNTQQIPLIITDGDSVVIDETLIKYFCTLVYFGMSSDGSSFELFGLMVKVPNDTVVEVKNGCYSYFPKDTAALKTDSVVEANYGCNSYYRKDAAALKSDTTVSASKIHTSPAIVKEISVQNSFDDMVSEQPSQRPKTLIVIDCANVGWAYGENRFSAEGIRIALAFFGSYDVDVAAFIPSSYLKRKPRDGTKGNSVMETDDWQELATLVRTGDVTVVPAGDHDDVYILSFARSNNGFIVSNDFFVDHISSIQEMSIQKSMKLWLNVNRCGFTFMKNSTFMINPGNVLSTVMGYLNFQERISDFDTSRGALINHISIAIQSALKTEGFVQLKYLLLSRASSYMELMLIPEALADLRLIVVKLDPNCADALKKIDLCLSVQRR